MRKLLHGKTRLLTALLMSIPCIFVYGDDANISPTINQDVPQWGIRASGSADNVEYGYVERATSFANNLNEQNSNYAEQATSLVNNVDEQNEIEACKTKHCDQEYGECCTDPCDVRARYHDNAMQTIERCDCGGIWLPEDPPLFRPFMADPREVCYSVGWRFNDNALTKNIIDVSFGDTLAIYRWCDMWPWHGQLQFEIEGAVWAVFDPSKESAPLINADYYVGFPLTYAIDRWQFRLRPFHISSHIGDEFLLNHPGFDRRNASNEYIDFFVSFDITPEIRFYGGVGYIVRQDESFRIKPFYSAAGAELRLMRLGFYDEKDLLVGFPIFGMHFRQNGEYKKHLDATYILGYQFSKLCGLCRNLRFFIEYHDGYSSEGQFCKDPTSYFAIRGSYGF